jgi:hypothetical protein
MRVVFAPSREPEVEVALVQLRRTFPSTVRTDNAPGVRFSVAVREEPEVEVWMV